MKTKSTKPTESIGEFMLRVAGETHRRHQQSMEGRTYLPAGNGATRRTRFGSDGQSQSVD